MYLLYLDESGSVSDASQRYFVLAGVAVHEKQTHWIEQDLNSIAARFDAANPYAVELHGAPMRSGRDIWKNFPQADRIQAMLDALKLGVADRHQRYNVRLFGAAIKKLSLVGQDPIEYAFAQTASRFDNYLTRQNRGGAAGKENRGLIVFDKAGTEKSIQALARDFKYSGHPWGKTRCFAEVPVFLDSKASRLIQLADLVAYALFRFHEHNDNRFYSVIARCFDTHGGVQHGLHVYL
jgi:uncharacterized protein DUF3800